MLTVGNIHVNIPRFRIVEMYISSVSWKVRMRECFTRTIEWNSISMFNLLPRHCEVGRASLLLHEKQLCVFLPDVETRVDVSLQIEDGELQRVLDDAVRQVGFRPRPG